MVQSEICNLEFEIRNGRLFFFRFLGVTNSCRGSAGRRFLLGRLPGGFSAFSLLITTVMRILIGRLFLHALIMSQIAVCSANFPPVWPSVVWCLVARECLAPTCNELASPI